MSTHRIMHGFEQFPAALMRATVNKISVQWGLAAQATHLAEIDNRLYWSGWTTSDFHDVHGRRGWTTLVAEVNFGERDADDRRNLQHTRLAGYLCAELFPCCVAVRRLGVAYPFQRLGVASALLGKVIDCLKPDVREQVVVEVDESNVPAHLLLRKLGFCCIKVTPAPTEKFIQRDPSCGDVYTFLYTCREEDRQLVAEELAAARTPGKENDRG